MREIKFRAWHKGNRSKNGRIINEPQMLHDEKPGDCLVYKNQGQNIESIMQFTGLLDKNGVEIYEGDVTKSLNGCKAIVEWRVYRWVLCGTDHQGKKFIRNLTAHTANDCAEVIGNIHQEDKS